MILAAGYGTRFRPVTHTMPKPLIPLCNRPLVGWVVDSLVSFGVEEVVVNLHHLPDMLRRWLDREYAGRVAVRYSNEPEILGTGGGLRKCRDHFAHEDVFLVVNGDTVQFPPYARLIDALRVSAAPAAMSLREAPRNDRFTSVWLDEGRVSSIGVNGEGEALMFAGVHAMTPEVFDLLPDRDVSGLTEDLYTPLLEEGVGIGAAIDDGPWFDIGTPARYLLASMSLLRAMTSGQVASPRRCLMQPLQQVLLDQSATIEGQVMRTAIGENVIVGRGCQVVDSAVWPDARIGDGALVESSIIADGVAIPAGGEVRNALVCRRSAQIPGGEYETVGDLVFVPVDPGSPVRVVSGSA